MKSIRTYVQNALGILINHSARFFCPVDCIPLDPNHVESQEDLMEKYKKLIAQKSASN